MNPEIALHMASVISEGCLSSRLKYQRPQVPGRFALNPGQCCIGLPGDTGVVLSTAGSEFILKMGRNLSYLRKPVQ
jgi:hypothetical protein